MVIFQIISTLLWFIQFSALNFIGTTSKWLNTQHHLAPLWHGTANTVDNQPQCFNKLFFF